MQYYCEANYCEATSFIILIFRRVLLLACTIIISTVCFEGINVRGFRCYREHFYP